MHCTTLRRSSCHAGGKRRSVTRYTLSHLGMLCHPAWGCGEVGGVGNRWSRAGLASSRLRSLKFINEMWQRHTSSSRASRARGGTARGTFLCCCKRYPTIASMTLFLHSFQTSSSVKKVNLLIKRSIIGHHGSTTLSLKNEKFNQFVVAASWCKK